MKLDRLKRAIPPGTKSLLRRFVYLPKDVLDSVTGKRDMYTPPKGIMFIGTADFKAAGNEFLTYFKELAGLQPNHSVLDVGCGLGRMAVPLIGYLNDEGAFEGFDIVPEGIRWATNTITKRHPNFRFRVADLYNKYYNAKGKQRSSEYVFPYADASFDLVFLGSVFTHMLPKDMEHFLDEIVRVLKPGGRALITYFLLNDESRKQIQLGKSTQDFKIPLDDFSLTVNKTRPEAAIAYTEERIRALYKERMLNIEEPIRYGKWCGRDQFLSYQDIVLAKKH
jgi:ubiquinone/menaquinone biosynthesis C-methylase UbiE